MRDDVHDLCGISRQAAAVVQQEGGIAVVAESDSRCKGSGTSTSANDLHKSTSGARDADSSS